jgi:hypothetical protein
MNATNAPIARPDGWVDVYCPCRATAADGGWTHGPCANCDDPAYIAHCEAEAERDEPLYYPTPDHDTRAQEAVAAMAADEDDTPWLGPLVAAVDVGAAAYYWRSWRS